MFCAQVVGCVPREISASYPEGSLPFPPFWVVCDEEGNLTIPEGVNLSANVIVPLNDFLLLRERLLVGSLVQKITDWGKERNLHQQSPQAGFVKVVEELEELAYSICKNKEGEQIDAIGDTFVTLINLTKQLGHEVPECLRVAYEEIKGRKGQIVNGVFVKESEI